MGTLKIDSQVRILNTGLSGVVKEIWLTAGSVQYKVRYADKTGAIRDNWFRMEELQIV